MNTQYSSLSLFYDAFMSETDYSKWCDFYEECFRRFSPSEVKKIVDVGCGTGNITLPLSARGYDMTGIDSSEEMLSLAAKKAEESSASVRFMGTDMRYFDLGFSADAAICSFDCINYLLTVSDMEAAFYRIRSNIKEGSVFVFDVATPYKYKNVLAGNAFVYENDDVFMTWENYLNERNGICDFYLTFFIRDGKKYRREDEEQRQRMYSLKTVRKAAEKAGFSIICECADLDFSPLKEESERAFFICRLPFPSER